MITIREILDKLPAQDRRKLEYAFEHRLTVYIPLPGNKFIGVYVATLKNLNITCKAGNWFYGEITK